MPIIIVRVHSVQFSCSVMSNSLRPQESQPQGLLVHHHHPEVTQTHVHRLGDAIQPTHSSRPLLLLPLIPPSIRVFSNDSSLCMRWPKYWSFSFSIIPSKEHPGLISIRMDRLDFRAVKGSIKSLLQHPSSKASVLWHSVIFTEFISHYQFYQLDSL